MNEQELNSFLEQNKKLINSKNAKTILKKVYEKTKEIDLKLLYDFLGEVLIEKPALQEKKNYIKFLEGYNAFISKKESFQVIKEYTIPLEQLFEMEQYFLEKYCLLEGENVLFSFQGRIIYRGTFSNRIFITNYRIIVLSKMAKVKGGVGLLGLLGVADITAALIARHFYLKKTKERSITKPEEIGMEKPSFGYQFPLFNPKATLTKTLGKTRGMMLSTEIEAKVLKLVITADEDDYEEKLKKLHKIKEIFDNIQEQQ